MPTPEGDILISDFASVTPKNIRKYKRGDYEARDNFVNVRV
jgi:hypothetical protein